MKFNCQHNKFLCYHMETFLNTAAMTHTELSLWTDKPGHGLFNQHGPQKEATDRQYVAVFVFLPSLTK